MTSSLITSRSWVRIPPALPPISAATLVGGRFRRPALEGRYGPQCGAYKIVHVDPTGRASGSLSELPACWLRMLIWIGVTAVHCKPAQLVTHLRFKTVPLSRVSLTPLGTLIALTRTSQTTGGCDLVGSWRESVGDADGWPPRSGALVGSLPANGFCLTVGLCRGIMLVLERRRSGAWVSPPLRCITLCMCTLAGSFILDWQAGI
jgi:hypothetical protein